MTGLSDVPGLNQATSNASQQIQPRRLASGVPGLDEHLGGGFLPGTLIVVLGATGIGKTQFGLHFVHGVQAEERRGVIVDFTCRGDAQQHALYAQRMFGWRIEHADGLAVSERLFSQPPGGHYLQAFAYTGRRVSRNESDEDLWHQWQVEINQRLSAASTFLYTHFVHGTRRAVFDGIEPVDRPADSIQYYLLEHLYHRVVRKDHDWVARDVLRQHYRALAQLVARHAYRSTDITTMALVTSQEILLEELVRRPLDEGDLLTNAATVIYMGKVPDGPCMRRALYIGKHRASRCSDEWIYYRITERGLELER